MEDILKFPTGRIPDLSPKKVPAEIIETWRAELRFDLHRRGLLEKILDDRSRMPRAPRFRFLDP